jgi:hypothetical protein
LCIEVRAVGLPIFLHHEFFPFSRPENTKPLGEGEEKIYSWMKKPQEKEVERIKKLAFSSKVEKAKKGIDRALRETPPFTGDALAQLIALRLYILVVKEEFEEALDVAEGQLTEKVVRSVERGECAALLIMALRCLGSPGLLLFKRDFLSHSQRYELALLCSDLGEMKRMGLVLMKKSPNYYAFAILREYMNAPSEETEYLLLKLLGKMPRVSNSLIVFLIQKGLPPEKLRFAVEKNKGILSVSYFYVLKELYIRGECVQAYLERPLEDILAKVDDWKVYEYAMERGVDIPFQKSINYLRYRMLAEKSDESIARFIASTNITLALPLLEQGQLLRALGHVPAEVECALKVHLSLPTSASERRLAVEHSPRTFVVVISSLLKKRTEHDTISALLLCREYRRRFEGSYEVDILHLFLCRYFLLYDEVVSLFSALDIKSFQLEKLVYAWFDIHVLLGLPRSLLASKYINTHCKNIAHLSLALMDFVEKGELAHCLSMLDLRTALASAPLRKEVRTMALSGEDTPLSIEDLLEPGARYIFRRAQKNTLKGRFITIETLGSVPEWSESRAVFERAFQETSSKWAELRDVSFMEHFLEMQRSAFELLGRTGSR